MQLLPCSACTQSHSLVFHKHAVQLISSVPGHEGSLSRDCKQSRMRVDLEQHVTLGMPRRWWPACTTRG